MKKSVVFVLCVILAAMALLSGCSSPLSRSIDKQRKLYQADELDLNAVFSETDGYHFPGITWGMTADEVRKQTGAPLDTVLGYTKEGDGIYSGNGLLVKLLGMTDDQTSVSATGEGLVYNISVNFTNSDDTEREMSLSQLYERYKALLQEKFGEFEETEDAHAVSDVSAVTQTSVWTYTDSTGRTTELQLAVARVSGAKEPSVLSLGFVWILKR